MEDAQMHIRLPRSLKDRVEASANEGKRSLNSEIVERLERSFQEGGGGRPGELERQMRSLEWRIAQLESRLQSEDALTVPESATEAMKEGLKRQYRKLTKP